MKLTLINSLVTACHVFYTKLTKWALINSLAIMFLSSAIFGLWFKIKQLSAISPELIRYYPVTGYLLTIALAFLVFSSLWLALTLITLIICGKNTCLKSHLLTCSLPFFAFWLAIWDIKLLYQVSLFWGLFLVFLLKIQNNKTIFHKIREPLLAFGIILAVFLVIFKTFSPLYHVNFFDIWGRTDYFINFEHQWENAKAYDFIGNFTQQGKLGGYSHSCMLVSELSSFIVLLFDIPLVDIFGKLASVKFMFFFLYFSGSYGCYLFLRYGLRLSFLASLIGGLGYILANRAFLFFFIDEFSYQHSHFVYLPWVLLLIKKGHNRGSPALVCLAGLIASLGDYTISAHPEGELLFIFFCNAYNFYLASFRLKKGNFNLKAVGSFLKYITILPVFNLLGLSYRLIPLFDSLVSREFALFDPRGIARFGMWWGGNLKYFSNFFFRIDDRVMVSIYSQTIFYTGQFTVFMIFAFICFLLVQAFRKCFQKNTAEARSIQMEDGLFFLVMFLILAVNVPIGDKSWLSKVLELTKFLRIHNVHRINVYLYFFALITSIFGFEYILRLKKLLNFNLVFLAYLLTLLAVYFNPKFIKAQPNKIVIDAVILLTIYFLISLRIKSYKLFRDIKLAAAFEYLISILLVATALFSFLTIDDTCRRYVMELKNKSIRNFFLQDRVFTSFRSAVTFLRNNQHDKASFEFLNRKLNKFKRDIASLRKYEESLCDSGVLSAEYCKKRSAYYEKIESIFKNNAEPLKLYEAIAPEIDNYYLNYGPMWVPFNINTVEWGILGLDIFNSVQFYLPDRYQLLAYSSGGVQRGMIPLGKNSELDAGLGYGVAVAYPSIDVEFHLKNLYYEGYYSGYEFDDYMFTQGFDLRKIISKDRKVQKLLNIYGIDYLLVHKFWLNSLESPLIVLKDLESAGFRRIELPDSSRFTPRFDKNCEMEVMQNLYSYGKAYIAKWVKVIKPGENLVNDKRFNYFNKWMFAKPLNDNFNHHISTIPDNIWRASLIESANPGDYSDSPYIYKADNKVDILKILGSKAVFDVDCQEDNCWFIYNTAALKGWKAYSESKRLPIYKANLGFIGLKLNKGKHFIWMEYKPFATTLGFIVTLSGWILVFLMLVLDSSRYSIKVIKP